MQFKEFEQLQRTFLRGGCHVKKSACSDWGRCIAILARLGLEGANETWTAGWGYESGMVRVVTHAAGRQQKASCVKLTPDE